MVGVPSPTAMSTLSDRPRNLGFGGGANAGFHRALELGATAIALLNDDIEVDPGWLEPLLAALESDPTLGAVQPKLLLAGSDPARINSVGVVVGGDGAGTRRRLRRTRRPAIRSGPQRSIRSPAEPCCSVRSSCRPPVDSTSRTSSTTRTSIWLAVVRRSAGRIDVSRRASCGTGSVLRPLNWATKLGICRSETVSGSPSGSESADTIRRALWLSIRRVRWSPRGDARACACWSASAWPRGPCWRASAPDKDLLSAPAGRCESRCVTAVSRVRM